jgi:tetratricopeptide (TPR) repeat protein
MKRIREFLLQENVVAFLCGLILLTIYLTTMCPTVSFIDSGELAAVAGTLGVAHPTGYPLFSIVGRIVTMLPVGGEEIIRLNTFAAMLTGSGMVFFFKTILLLLRNANPRITRKSSDSISDDLRSKLAAVTGTLALGFSTTVWMQSTSIEVYALHLMLLSIILYAALRGVLETLETPQQFSPFLFLAAFVLGLSFANHLTTLLILPALTLLFFRAFRDTKERLYLGSRLALFFSLGLSVYLLLPLRAVQRPPLNWGYATDLERFLWHVSGKQYRSWIFSGFESASRQLSYFVQNLHNEIHWLGLALALIGVAALWVRNREMLYFWGIAFVGCLLYSINYDIHDIDSYFLLAYVSLGVFVSFGIFWLVDLGAKRRWLWLPALALPFVQLAQNFSSVDESDNTLVRDYTLNILENLDSNAVVLSYQWDYFVSPALYFQTMRNIRRDVVVIDKELFRRSWYLRYLGDYQRWLIDLARPQVEAFLVQLAKFEKDEPYDPRIIEARFVEMMRAFIKEASKMRPVYVGPEIEPEFLVDFKRIPAGLVFRLAGPNDTVSLEKPKIQFKNAKKMSKDVKGIKSQYSQMLSYTALALRDQGKIDEALEMLELVTTIDPEFLPGRQLRERLVQERVSN